MKLVNAISKDLAEEIEEAANRVVVYTSAQDHTSPTATSTVITFSDDRKSATVIVGAALATGGKYKVAFVDNNNTTALAKVVTETSSFAELIPSIAAPEVVAESTQDKYTLTFAKKMNSAAETAGNYKVYDSTNNEVTGAIDTATFVTGSDSKKVTLKVDAGKLQAGKTYTVIVDNSAVKAADGSELTTAQSKFTIKTPSVSEATPKFVGATVTGTNTILVAFDKDLKTNASVDTDLISLKTSTGVEVPVTSAAISGKALQITTTSSTGDLVAGKTYKLEVAASAGINDLYRNVTTTALTTNVKAADNVAAKSVSAKFVRDETDAEKFDLVLTFDQQVDGIASATAGDVVINALGQTINLVATTAVSKYTKDVTGKSLVINDIGTAFSGLKMVDGASYQVVVKAGEIATTTPAGTPVKNATDLKTTVAGLDVTAPEVKTTTIHSNQKITVEFDETIDASKLKAANVKVAGFVKAVDGTIAQQTLTGSAHLNVAVSGKVLTITPANSAVTFVTGDTNGVTNVVEIESGIIADANGITSSAPYAVTATDIDDNAAPVILAGEAKDDDTLVLTYSENVDFKATGSSNEEATQFKLNGFKLNGFATTASTNNNEITLTLVGAFETGKDYAASTVEYLRNSNYQVQDSILKSAANVKFTGIANNY